MTQLILSNSAVGIHSCNVTKRAEETIATKYLLGKMGASEGYVKICGASDFPIGIITDEATVPSSNKNDEIVNVSLLSSSDTLKAVAGSAITAGAILIPADGGKVRAMPAASATDITYTMIGVALSAAIEGREVEFMSCVPQQHVVKGS